MFFINFLKKQPPGRLIAMGFAFVILTGAVVLVLPVSVWPDAEVSFVDALFTSTSAVCVTGLIAIDVADPFTPVSYTHLVPQSKINIVPGTFEDIQQRDSFSLAGCTLEIGIASNGVEVSFVTSATQTANEIGVKDVVLQQKTWYGWKDIPISNHSTNNSDIYIGGVISVSYTHLDVYKRQEQGWRFSSKG